MPAVRTSRSKKAPEGFSEIEDTLLEFENRLKDGKANFLHLNFLLIFRFIIIIILTPFSVFL